MSYEEFEGIFLTVGIAALILYMGFIVYNLGKESKAGKFGYFVLFLALGLGVLGFVVKTVIIKLMDL